MLFALLIASSGCGVQNSQSPRHWSLTHSAEKQSPYSQLNGRTITVMPIGLTFDIPESWTKQIYKKSLFLSWDDLNEVNKPAIPDFERETSAVLDTVVDFRNCAVHAGEKGWNVGVVSDQLRLYLSNEKTETILERVEKNGLAIAKESFDKANLSRKSFAGWDNRTISYVHAPTHAISISDIAFYVRTHNDLTLVFVFLPGREDLVHATLNSLAFPK